MPSNHNHFNTLEMAGLLKVSIDFINGLQQQFVEKTYFLIILFKNLFLSAQTETVFNVNFAWILILIFCHDSLFLSPSQWERSLNSRCPLLVHDLHPLLWWSPQGPCMLIKTENNSHIKIRIAVPNTPVTETCFFTLTAAIKYSTCEHNLVTNQRMWMSN